MPRRDLTQPTTEPGKYEGEIELTEVLDGMDADEETGDVEALGHYRLYLGLTAEEVEGNIGRTKAAILHTDDYGFVTGTYYESDNEANDEWTGILKEEAEGYEDDDDDE